MMCFSRWGIGCCPYDIRRYYPDGSTAWVRRWSSPARAPQEGDDLEGVPAPTAISIDLDGVTYVGGEITASGKEVKAFSPSGRIIWKSAVYPHILDAADLDPNLTYDEMVALVGGRHGRVRSLDVLGANLVIVYDCGIRVPDFSGDGETPYNHWFWFVVLEAATGNLVEVAFATANHTGLPGRRGITRGDTFSWNVLRYPPPDPPVSSGIVIGEARVETDYVVRYEQVTGGLLLDDAADVEVVGDSIVFTSPLRMHAMDTGDALPWFGSPYEHLFLAITADGNVAATRASQLPMPAPIAVYNATTGSVVEEWSNQVGAVPPGTAEIVAGLIRSSPGFGGHIIGSGRVWLPEPMSTGPIRLASDGTVLWMHGHGHPHQEGGSYFIVSHYECATISTGDFATIYDSLCNTKFEKDFLYESP